MSLTSFLKNKDVRESFKREFEKPSIKLYAELLAPPLTKHYWLVGTAFDYLLRFYIKYQNPEAVETRWVSEYTLSSLQDNEIYRKVDKIIRDAKKNYSEFIKNGIMSYSLFKSVLLLAQVDAIYRAGIIDETLGKIDEDDIEDLQNLISLVKPKMFKSKEVCLLNPEFGEASQIVGGADCDLVIDETLIEIKTTKKIELTQDYFNQLLGYYILYKIGGINGLSSKHEVKRLGIYFSRFAYLYTIEVQNIINKNTFPDFIAWFEKRARQQYKF